MEAHGVLDRGDGERIAWKRVEGRGPTLVWLNGFRSDMEGTKALALVAWALAHDRSLLRFDYFGHGASSGEFVKGTIGRWRSDALAVVDELTQGPLVLLGSSMGGWIACLVALARVHRIAAMVLIAPAADFTEKLLEPGLDGAARAALAADGVWSRPSAYGDSYPITRDLLREGATWSILPGPVKIDAPVRILQGGVDPDVPWRYALDLALAFTSDDVVFSLIRDGDHRLSRPQDLARLIETVSGFK